MSHTVSNGCPGGLTVNMSVVVGISLLAGAVAAFPEGTRWRFGKVCFAWLASSALVGGAVLAFGAGGLPFFLAAAGFGLVMTHVAGRIAPREPWAA